VRDFDSNAAMATQKADASRENHCLVHGCHFLALRYRNDLRAVPIPKVVELYASK
jgi:hypothetical protein